MADLSKYAWADYLHCMDGLPDPIILPSAKAPPRTQPHWIWGLGLAAAVAATAVLLSELPFPPFTLAGNRHPIEPVMFAIVLGMLLANILPLPKLLMPGFKFTAKRLLPLAIVLLGARLDFFNLVKAGAAGLVLSVLTIMLGLGLFLLFTHLRWVEYKLGLLLGVGTAICGGTAIVAAAPVIDAEDKDVSFSVATVTLCGLLAMFLLPLAAGAMHMRDEAFGIWAGLSIHQTPQVVAAGYARGNAAGDMAMIVKLARVSLLAPALVAVGWIAARHNRTTTGRLRVGGLFPMFILGFLAMALLKTCGLLPSVDLQIPGSSLLAPRNIHFNLANAFEAISKLLIVAAMAAVGLETRFAALRQTGARPLILSLAAATIICGLILIGLKIVGT